MTLEWFAYEMSFLPLSIDMSGKTLDGRGFLRRCTIEKLEILTSMDLSTWETPIFYKCSFSHFILLFHLIPLSI